MKNLFPEVKFPNNFTGARDRLILEIFLFNWNKSF